MALGGFETSGRLLEFDQVLGQLSGYARTELGRQRATELEPSDDLLEVATRQQETTEARRYIDDGGSLEFGPEQDITELVQRALLGGLLRGAELYAVRSFARAARYDRDELSDRETLPLLSSLASNIPDLGHLDREIGAAISPAGEVLDYASPLLGRLAVGVAAGTEPAERHNGAQPAPVPAFRGDPGAVDHPTQRAHGPADQDGDAVPRSGNRPRRLRQRRHRVRGAHGRRRHGQSMA